MHNNELLKTGIFVGVAAVLGILVLATTPRSAVVDEMAMEGRLLFPDFTDATAIKSLEVVTYDEKSAETVVFEVAQVDGRWCIPSNDDYPADAEDHLGEVAAQLIDLKAVTVAATSDEVKELGAAKLFKDYGVVDPQDEDISDGEGVGMKIVLRDKDNQAMLNLIVGAPTEGDSSIRFVRIADQNPIYTTKVSIDGISADFGDWIEKNLLDIDSWDISQITIDDYFIEKFMAMDGLHMRRRDNNVMTLDYDDMGDPKWKMVSDLAPDPTSGELVEQSLTDNEELDVDALNSLKSALDDLKIVDVEPKPEALAASLAESGVIPNDEAVLMTLAGVGFIADRRSRDLVSDQGQTMIRMKDGVTYVLRFGDLTGEGDAETDAEDAGGMYRYLFVMAAFDESALEQPVLEPLKDVPTEGDTAAIDAENEAIKAENDKRQAEYDKKLEDAEKRVAELNKRFAKWYYVIDENVFKEIHLTRADIVMTKASEGGDDSSEGGPLDVLDMENLNLGGLIDEPINDPFQPGDDAPEDNSFQEFQHLKDTAPTP